MPKVIRDCIGFALLRSVIGLENSRHPLNQSDAKVKPTVTWLLTFSRASGRLPVFTLSSHWLPLKFSFVLIGRYDYFGFAFTTLNRKAVYNGYPQKTLITLEPTSSNSEHPHDPDDGRVDWQLRIHLLQNNSDN